MSRSIRYRPRVENLEARIALSAECVTPNENAFSGLCRALDSMGENSQAVEHSAVFQCFDDEECETDTAAATAELPTPVPGELSLPDEAKALDHIPVDSRALDHAPPLGGTLPTPENGPPEPGPENGPPDGVPEPVGEGLQTALGVVPEDSHAQEVLEDLVASGPTPTVSTEHVIPDRPELSDPAEDAILLALGYLDDHSQATEHSPIFYYPATPE
jgi:hypothetical protein